MARAGQRRGDSRWRRRAFRRRRGARARSAARCIRLRLNDVDRAGHGAALWLSVDAAYERLVRGQELPDALVVALGLGWLGEAS